MARWRDRFEVLGDQDAPELEAAAAMHEIGEGMPRHAAEERAHRAWLARQLTHAAAHHLAGTRAAHAAGDQDAATRHATHYAVAMKALGYPVVGEPPPEIAALARDPRHTQVVQFKGHPADGLLLEALRSGRGKPLGKAESPIAGVPVDHEPGGAHVWDMSHLLPKESREAGVRLHVREGARPEGFLFEERGGHRRPVASYQQAEGEESSAPHPWEAARPTTDDENEAVTRAFRLRRMVGRAQVASAGKRVADLIDRARRGLG